MAFARRLPSARRCQRAGNGTGHETHRTLMAVASGLAGRGPLAQRLNLGRYRDLVKVLAERSLKVRYRGSVLGVYWSLLNPLFMTAMYTAIFGSAFSAYYDHSLVNYILACFVGLIALNFFSQTSTQALSSIVGNGALLNKLEMPPSVFPISMVAANVFQFAVGALPLLIIVTALRTHSIVNVLLLIVPTVALLLLTTGFSLLTSSLYVFFRDLPYMYELVVFVLWLTSPIFYPKTFVPVTVRAYLALNPLAEIIDSYRTIAFVPGLSNLHTLAYALVGGGLALMVGCLAFLALRSNFLDLL
jgi:ABC-type polysaccharide/polyol phosphate export permease